MIESVHCPQCQAHYGLRSNRVRYGLRRAKCLRCGGIFPIEDEVTRLLAAGLPQESYQPSSAFAQTFSIPVADLAAVHEVPVVELPDLDPDFTLPVAHEALPDLPSMALDEPVEEMPNSLTLQDLGGEEEDVLDKTLVDFTPPPTPEAPLTSAEEPPAEAITTGGFSSARDAIDKILGGMGSPAARPAQGHASSNPMDLEATLSALDKTLGGQSSFPVPTPEQLAPQDHEFPVFSMDETPEAPPEDHARATMHVEAQPEAAPATVRLTREEMMAALATPVEAPNAEDTPHKAMPLMGAPAAPPSALPPMDSTLVMNVPPLPPPPPIGAPTPFMPVAESAEQNYFKIQLGQELLNNMSMDQMADLVMQGRLGDYHMVARQFSENWIEAGKVPALRPVFERFRREQIGTIEAPPAEAPQKRSLFGGLFGRKDA